MLCLKKEAVLKVKKCTFSDKNITAMETIILGALVKVFLKGEEC